MRYLLPVLLMLAGCGGCASVPTHDDLRATSLRLTLDSGVCSGTAVGRDLLVTAKHCGGIVAIDGKPATVTVHESGKLDLVVLKVTGVEFNRWAKRGTLPKQGDRVRWWGNPVGEANVYRQGYVARVQDGTLVIAAQICKGDSGAGIFNDKGEVVGIVSAMTAAHHCQFALSFP